MGPTSRFNVPDTQASLVLRLPDAEDTEAWSEFCAIYQPLIYRLARRQGLQDSDAQDLAQEVMVAVSRAAERWVPDPERGPFRAWLFRIARNLIVNYLTRKKHQPLGQGGSTFTNWLNQQAGIDDPDLSATIDLEFRREVFAWAADQVRRQVKADTWQAFWRTSVLLEPIADVAQSLAMTPGAVYIARSRVMARLQDAAARWKEIYEPSGDSR